MALIDGDKIITIQLYDDQYEVYTDKQMSIIDCINTYTDEGVTIADDVLDNLRAEIETLNPFDYGYHRNDMLDAVLNVIDRYRNGVNE